MNANKLTKVILAMSLLFHLTATGGAAANAAKSVDCEGCNAASTDHVVGTDGNFTVSILVVANEHGLCGGQSCKQVKGCKWTLKLITTGELPGNTTTYGARGAEGHASVREEDVRKAGMDPIDESGGNGASGGIYHSFPTPRIACGNNLYIDMDVAVKSGPSILQKATATLTLTCAKCEYL